MTDRLRVLAVSPSGVLGGAEDVFFHLVTGGLGAGLDVRPALLADGPLRQKLTAAGHDVAVVDAGRLRDPLGFARATRDLTALAREVDVVYANQPKAHLYTALAARRAKRPAWWCQVNVPEGAMPLDRAASALPARGVIAASEAAAEVQRRIPRTPPVVVVHPGSDTSRFRPDVLPALVGEGPLVGIVGRLQPWKGQDLFLRAARIVAARRPVRFAVVGGALLGTEGDYERGLHLLAAELGLDVAFPGHVDDVPAWMTACDVVVNASWPEPFGLVVTEAMAAGRPVVAFDRGGPAEIVTSGVDGVLVGEHSAEALAAAVGALLDDDDARSRIGAAARKTVEAKFSVRAMCEGYAAAFSGSGQ